ncbi:hypothetical protein [Nitrososphaera sp.]|uniref:hypothetical protein n=1 Tax=Nitrososphaera sp. TaxID=1971748 RepID=UPI00182D24C2|nr:hypothetical protein [Nitrososphaera sp.]NWG36132.1 hypothetical protein [Nitrososphaera sp.]
MARKFVLALAGVVAAMAALIAIPSLNQPPQEALSIEYSRQNVTRTDQGLVTQSAELLSIAQDGSATYTQAGGQERRIPLSGEELGRIRGLILETGFMQISATNYPQSDNATDFTKYTLRVSTDEGQKTFNWVSPGAHGGVIPPIITNVGSQLDAIMDR